MDDLLLTPAEIAALTGYRMPHAQLAELHRQGFTRARRSPTSGSIIVERAHYLAVSAGHVAPQRPKVRPPQLRPSPVA